MKKVRQQLFLKFRIKDEESFLWQVAYHPVVCFSA
jgi:hypothetical protein